MHQLQWCLKTIGQILEGSRKPGQIPCNTWDPDPANIYIYMPSSFELSRYMELLACCCACSESWTAARSRVWWRAAESAWICIWMLFMEDIFQVLISKIPCTKVLQYSLPKSCMRRCPTVQKQRRRRLFKACSHQSLISMRKVDFPQVWVCICLSPPLWLGSLTNYEIWAHTMSLFPTTASLGSLFPSWLLLFTKLSTLRVLPSIPSLEEIGQEVLGGKTTETPPLKCIIPTPTSQWWNLGTQPRAWFEKCTFSRLNTPVPTFSAMQLGEV